MNKIKKVASNILMGIGLLSISLIGYDYLSSGNISDKVSPDVIRKIGKVDISLGYNDLRKGDSFSLELFDYLKANVKYSRLPPVFKAPPIPYYNTEVVILISSNGGSVSKMFSFIKTFKFLKRRGLKVKCYIGNAKSAAFTFMLSVCDTRILLKGAELAQHPTYLPYGDGKLYTTHTKYSSVEMSDIEAKVLDIDPKKWYNITRNESKDKFFTEKEALKYKIVHKVLK